MTTGLRVLFATADRTLAKGLHRGSPYTLQAVVGPSKVYMYSAATCLTISDYPTAGIVCTANDSLSRNDKPVSYDYLISNVLCRPGYGVLYATSKGAFPEAIPYNLHQDFRGCYRRR